MSDVRTIRVCDYKIDIGPMWSVVRFSDGTEVHAHPNYTDEELARAHSLGYGEDPDPVAAMTRDHDLLHALLADARGWWHSNVTWAVAHGQDVGPGGDDEERIVMLLHHLARRGVDGVLEDREAAE